jgi:ubiquinone/menaquinone biosynthesis C-methylase UbiE
MTVSSLFSTDSMVTMRDRYHVPGVLSPFAEEMARRLSRTNTGPLLEVHADTGVLTRAIASSVSAGLTIIATDPSGAMIAHASRKPGLARVTWKTADPRALPFPDATFGIATCHFAVATMPDRIQAFRDVRRVLKQGGRFVFSVPGPIRQNPVADCLQDTLEAMFPADPPRFLEHGLHGYADNEAVDDDLTVAGFTDAIYTAVALPYAAASVQDAAMGYCLGTLLRSEIEARAPGETERVVQIVAAALERRFGPGPVATTMRAHMVSASG